MAAVAGSESHSPTSNRIELRDYSHCVARKKRIIVAIAISGVIPTLGKDDPGKVSHPIEPARLP